ncbi:hypothetical protein SEPCBS119000_004360 [Sporothrix epigloea]|uniref:BZIP domain-containing protein n=1 Tax=Sporothrix epigloea TaxID=1892477 RepID=A0ABP0DRQ0_9PEZI
MRSLKTKGGHTHGRKQHGDEPLGSSAAPATTPYTVAHPKECSEEHDVPPTLPVLTRTKISALLNDENSTATDLRRRFSKITGSDSGQPAQGAHSTDYRPAENNAVPSTLLSEQRSTQSLNSAYTYHANKSFLAELTYASDDERTYLRQKSGVVDEHASELGRSSGNKHMPSQSRSKHTMRSRSRDGLKNEENSLPSMKGHTESGHEDRVPPTIISSSAFSVGNMRIMPYTPSRHPAMFTSTSTSSVASDGNDGNEDGESYTSSRYFRGSSVGSRDTPTASLGRLREEASLPATFQRERNRAAATKCRAKSKAAITKLEEDERAVTEEHSALSAQKVELVDEVLSLRMELIRHGHCVGNDNIQNYLNNAARVIGDSGGRNMFWGPDGNGIDGSSRAPENSASIQQGSKKKRHRS